MPADAIPPDCDATYAYYQAISDAVAVPVWIQNAGIVALSIDQVVKLCTEIEHVRWVKEEVNPGPQRIGQLIDRKCPAIDGVMGGYGGRYMITDWARGAAGDSRLPVLRRRPAHLGAARCGRRSGGAALFEHVLPGLTLEGLMGMAFAKEMMSAAGVQELSDAGRASDGCPRSDARSIACGNGFSRIFLEQIHRGNDCRVRDVHCDYRASDEEVYQALKRATDPLTAPGQAGRARPIGIKFNQDWPPEGRHAGRPSPAVGQRSRRRGAAPAA